MSNENEELNVVAPEAPTYVEPVTDVDKAKTLLGCKVIATSDLATDTGISASMISAFRNDEKRFENARLKQISAMAKAYDQYAKQLDFSQPNKIVRRYYYSMVD